MLDQQVGGCVMLVVGGVSFLIGGLVLTRDVLRRHLNDSCQSMSPRDTYQHSVEL